MITYLFLLGAAYLVGAIPTGYLFAHYCFNIDITKQGSGNVGATNVARTLGKQYFVLIFIIDALKAGAFLYATSPYGSAHTISCAFALLLGNAFSIFLNFKGGKGVATSFGILWLLIGSSLMTIFAILWLTTLKISSHAFLASVLSLITITCLYYNSPGFDPLIWNFLLFLNVWCVLRHIPNIKSVLRLT
jgi:glycerol-3-phosphate acyltransferase PlsY